MSTIKKAWKCTVCGYVHYGEDPPDVCPVCGATADLFELIDNLLPDPKPLENISLWRCLNCEYIHKGESPPQSCPVCGVSADRYEPYTSKAEKGVVEHKKGLHIVIAGAGIAGVSAAEAVRKTMADARITLISKETNFPYYRLNLTRYLSDEIKEEQLLLHPEEWYESNGISLLAGKELCTINTEKKQLILRNEETLEYDRLIVTVGSHPFIPPIAGSNRENITSLRTKENADFILKQCHPKTHVVIIGGGILGLEAAGALAAKSINVTILEGYGWLLPRQLNQKAGLILEEFVSSLGIKVQKNSKIKEIVGDDRVRGVLLEDGRTIPAELVLITTGVRSNSYIARLAGLDVNHGIVVNNYLRTSNDDIYAAGDVAEHFGVNYGTWGPSQFQGTIAGINAAGGESEFAGIPRSNLLKVLGYDMFSIGQISGEDGSYLEVERKDEISYYFFLFHDSHMVGAIMLGQTDFSSKVKKIIEKKVDCSFLLSMNPDVSAILDFLEKI